MAKRIDPSARAPQTKGAPAYPACRVCGGAIVLEERDKPVARFPRRLLCRVCGNEYGTTRTAERNY